MSSLRVLFAGALATACLGGPLRAQDPDSLRRSMELRRERLEVVNRLYARADTQHLRERMAREQEPLDTVRVGPFPVVAPSAVMPRARAEFESAWRELEPWLGGAVAAIEPRTFLVTAGRTVRAYSILMRRGSHRQVKLPSAWAPHFGNPVRSALADGVASVLPRDVQRWGGGARILQPQNWEAVYRGLALSSAAPARRCFDGDMAQCRFVLMVTNPGSAYERWYTPEQVRAFAMRRRSLTPTTLGRQCEAGRQEACVLQLNRLGGPPPPVPLGARSSLAFLALERGGSGSIARLVADSGVTLEERLERASGDSLDALVRDWHARVIAARPATNAGLGTTTVSALLITALILLLARRSTRWRIG